MGAHDFGDHVEFTKRDDEAFEERLSLHQKMLDILKDDPSLQARNLREYMEYFLNPGEVIYQEVVVLVDEAKVGEDFVEEGRTEVVVEENGFLMHVKVPHEREDTGGMWAEVHSVESAISFDNHDKFKRMLGRPIRVTVEILDKPS